MDRAGFVGADGSTHHGTLDLSIFGCIPNLTIMAPSDELELKYMVSTQASYNDGPTILRYPRGNGYGVDKLRTTFGYQDSDIFNNDKRRILEIGKGRIVRTCSSSTGVTTTGGGYGCRGLTKTDRVAILSLGTRLEESLLAAQLIEEIDPDVCVTVADARFMKPLDTNLIQQLADEHSCLVSVEEGTIGGFGDHVLHYLSYNGFLDNGELRFRPMIIPDDIIFEASTQYQQYEKAGLNAKHINDILIELLSSSRRRRNETKCRT